MLYEGDSRQILPLLRNLEGPIHAVVTDPPADIVYLTADQWEISDRHSLLVEVMSLARELVVPGAFALVWSLPREQHRTAYALEEAGYVIRDVICHHFGTGQPKSGGLKPATEFWTVAQNGIGRKLNAAECMILDPTNLPKKWEKPRGGFWTADPDTKAKLVDNPNGRWPANVVVDEFVSDLLPRFFYVTKPLMSARKGHPTPKALDLMSYLVRLVTWEGEMVLDPFAGSGTTGLGAQAVGRSFIGIEKDARYARLARGRLSEATR